jgi:CubicO group peptidase (beta-lactamase class C family)
MTAALETRTYPAVERLLDSFVGPGNLPGSVVSIGRGASDPPDFVARGTIAFDSDRPADETALWRSYSMTKPVTGILTMILIGEGKLTLDTPVAEFIPGFARTRILTSPETDLDSVPGKSVMRVRHLLTHTAGLGYNLISKGPLLAELERLGVMPRKMSRAYDAPIYRAPDLASFADRLATLPLVAEPGTWWSYSVGLEIAGRVIEVVEGKPLDAAMKDKLFDPLGMTDSFFQVPADRAGDLSTTYEIVDGKPVPFDPGSDSTFLDRPDILSGGVGIVCTARDYDRFLAMLAGWGTLGDVQLMTPEIARLAMSDILPDTVDRRSVLIPGGFGAGGRVSIEGPDKGSFGWFGAAGTAATVDPDRGLRVSGWLQFMPSTALAFPQQVVAAATADVLGTAGA